MASRVLEYLIKARDLTREGVSSALARVRTLRRTTSTTAAETKRDMGGIGQAVAAGAMNFGRMALMTLGIGTAFAAVSTGARLFTNSIKAAFEFERYQTQFSVLFGSMEKAKTHFAALTQFAATTPFQLPDAVSASRQLYVLSGGAMGAEGSLRLVGDAAAVTGQQMGEVATWIGRAYGAIKAGQPFGMAARRLQEMGILGSEARIKMEELRAGGASAAEQFAVLQGELMRFSGGMEIASKTGEGLASTLRDNVTQTLATLGGMMQEAAKTHIAGMIDAITELRENKLDAWATNLSIAMATVENAIGPVLDKLAKLNDSTGRMGAISDTAKLFNAPGAGLTALTGYATRLAFSQGEDDRQLAKDKFLSSMPLRGMQRAVGGTIYDAFGGAPEKKDEFLRNRYGESAAEKTAAKEKAAADLAAKKTQEAAAMQQRIQAELAGMQADLAKAEQDRIEKAIRGIEDLQAADQYAEQALLQAKAENSKRRADIEAQAERRASDAHIEALRAGNSPEAAAAAAAAVRKTELDKAKIYDPSTGAGAEALLASVTERTPELRKQGDAAWEAQQKQAGAALMAMEADFRRLSLELTAQDKPDAAIAQIEAEIAALVATSKGERGPVGPQQQGEIGQDIAAKGAEIMAIRQGKDADLGSGLKEFFLAMRGQRKQDRLERNTDQMVKILGEIRERAGMGR